MHSAENKDLLDVLAIGAHPDDVELACGGTLLALAQRGYRTGIVSLTRGEMSTSGDVHTRMKEFDKAAEILGTSVHRRLTVGDTRIEQTWDNRLLVIELLRTHRPRILLAPYWETRHPDHEHTSHLVREAAYYAGLSRIQTQQIAYRPASVLYYCERFEFLPSFVVDITDVHEQKMDAIRAYRSQFYIENDATDNAKTLINQRGFLEGINARDGFYGAKINVAFGEPFLVREALRVDDPIAHFSHAGLV